MSVKLKGTVKWFDTTKGFGFLLVDDDRGDTLSDKIAVFDSHPFIKRNKRR